MTKGTRKTTNIRKAFFVRIDDLDIRVRATSYAKARRQARAGKGRVVGVYFN